MTNSDIFYGEVVWFDPKRGYGFISRADVDDVKQQDLFVHFSDIAAEGFKTLFKGQKVSFGMGVNKNGVPKATNVMVLKN